MYHKRPKNVRALKEFTCKALDGKLSFFRSECAQLCMLGHNLGFA